METASLQEACGVVGFLTTSEDATALTYYALETVQNRGKDAAGIAILKQDGQEILTGRGEVKEVFDHGDRLLGRFSVRQAIGHVLYSTDESSKHQPFDLGDNTSFAHNGQITNARSVSKHLKIPTGNASDSELMAKMIRHKKAELGSTEAALNDILPRLSGAFSAILMEPDRIIAIRDRRGFRPLSIGRTADGGYGVASESAVFDIIDGEHERSVRPGTYDIITRNGVQTHQWALGKRALCGIELAYFSRPDSEIDGVSVATARENMGRLLAEDHPVKADLVIAVPDSGRIAADGYATASGIPQKNGFARNSYVGRTYNMASSALRKTAAALKNNPIRSIVAGKEVILIDDSMVRGNTMKQLVSKVRRAGAQKVHLRTAFPAIKHPCFYGVNMQQKDGLISADHTPQEILDELELDSLGQPTPERFLQAVGAPLCLACVTGEYPEQTTDRVKALDELRTKNS